MWLTPQLELAVTLAGVFAIATLRDAADQEVSSNRSPAPSRAYERAGDVSLPPPRPGTEGMAILPRDSVVLPAAEAGCTQTLGPDANVQRALRRARGGDVLCLTPGATYEPITLPQRRDSGWVTLRTAAPDSTFALPGTRVRPSAVAALARIVTKGDLPAIRTQLGAERYRLIGLEVTTDVNSNALVALGAAGEPQTTLDVVPRELILDRMWIHGTPTLTVRRCIALNSAASAVIDSWVDDCHEKGADSQAIWGGNGPGPYLIENNYLAGAGENIMFGGSDPAIRGLVPSDIIIRRNHIVAPISWKGRWSRKNLIETKNARRMLIEGNVIEGSWSDGQVGYAMIFKSENQGGRCRWCITSDITVRRNMIRKIGAGINLSGLEGSNPSRTDSAARRFLFVENVLEDVNVPPYDGEGRLLQFLSGVQHVIFERNVIVSNGPIQRAVSLQRANSVFGLVMKGNVLSHGQYGFMADEHGSGSPALRAAPNAAVQGNVFVPSARGGGGRSTMAGFTYAGTIGIVPVNTTTRALVNKATQGVVIEP